MLQEHQCQPKEVHRWQGMHLRATATLRQAGCACRYQFAEASEHASPPEQQPPAPEAAAANGKRKSPSLDPLQTGAQVKRPKAEGGDPDKLALINRQKRRMEVRHPSAAWS